MMADTGPRSPSMTGLNPSGGIPVPVSTPPPVSDPTVGTQDTG